MLSIYFAYPTGKTLLYSVMQLNTGLFYDFGGNDFAAQGSVGTLQKSLPELSSPFLGIYSDTLSNTITNAWADGDYIVFATDQAPVVTGNYVSFSLSAVIHGGSDTTVIPASSSQIPADFTSGLFAAPGIFSAGALANTPPSLGSSAPAGWINAASVAAGALIAQEVGSVAGNVNGNVAGTVAAVANLQGVSLDFGSVASVSATATFTSSSNTLTATVSGAYNGSVILFQTTASLGRVRRVVTNHTYAAGIHSFVTALTSGSVPSVGPSVGDTFVVE